MAITGAHVLLYTPEADDPSATLRDVFGWDHVDAGEGWLISRCRRRSSGSTLAKRLRTS